MSEQLFSIQQLRMVVYTASAKLQKVIINVFYMNCALLRKSYDSFITMSLWRQ